jgi:hypothetical protein
LRKTVLPIPDALSVEVAIKSPATAKFANVPCNHVEFEALPQIPIGDVDVAIPLFVTVTAPDTRIGEAIVRRAVESIDSDAEKVNSPVTAIVPDPSRLLLLVDMVIAPVPFQVPFTAILPAAVTLNVD